MASTEGTYLNEASGTAADGIVVVPSRPTAQIVVTETSNVPPDVEAGGPYGGNEGDVEGVDIALDGTVTDPDTGDTVTTTWSYVADPGVDADATCMFADESAVDTTITCTDDGTYTLILAADDGVNAEVTDMATLTVLNATPTVDVTAPTDGSHARGRRHGEPRCQRGRRRSERHADLLHRMG